MSPYSLASNSVLMQTVPCSFFKAQAALTSSIQPQYKSKSTKPGFQLVGRAQIIYINNKDLLELDSTDIKADKPQEAEDQHLQLIFQVFFSFHLIYLPLCCKRTISPAKQVSKPEENHINFFLKISGI